MKMGREQIAQILPTFFAQTRDVPRTFAQASATLGVWFLVESLEDSKA